MASNNTVRAKFKVDRIVRSRGSRRRKDEHGNPVSNEKGYAVYDPCELWTIHLQPVYGGDDASHENKKFWEATPCGAIELGTVNADVVHHFDLEREFYVDFTPAEG